MSWPHSLSSRPGCLGSAEASHRDWAIAVSINGRPPNGQSPQDTTLLEQIAQARADDIEADESY